MCGFIGIYGADPKELAGQLLTGLMAIQHRGQDAAGVLTFDGRFHLRKGMGLVRDVFSPEDVEALTGSLGIGHVRYPTVGLGGAEDAQPFVISYPVGIGMAHNGNVTNFDEIRDDMSRRSHWHVNSSCDLEGILKVFGDGLAQRRIQSLGPEDVFDAAQQVFDRVKGAYSVVGIDAHGGMVAFRDPYGIKPIIVGRRELPDGRTSWCVASESTIMDILDFHQTFDLEPGEVFYVDAAGEVHRRVLTEKPHCPCLFEWVYFARPDSFLDRVSVYKARKRMGELMADTWRSTGWHADVVIPVPESSVTSAQALAQELDLPYREGLVKNRYIGRTFIMPSPEARQRSVRLKLNPIQLEFEGKDVLLVDDSIVRGTTSRQIVEMARRAGARKVYFASVSPALRYPCIYGIDMSTKNEFVARDRDAAQIAAEIGADGVVYQTLEDLKTSVTEGNKEITSTCGACFTGEYPTGDVDDARLKRIEQERLVAAGDDASPAS